MWACVCVCTMITPADDKQLDKLTRQQDNV